MYEPLQFVLLMSQNNGISRKITAAPKLFMTLITITSDYGTTDHDVAVFKAGLFSTVNDIQIVDISHEVSPFNTMQAAYLARRSFRHFPEGSIHLILVDAEWNPNRSYLLASIDGRYFVAADNGVLSLIAPEKQFDQLVSIDLRNGEGLQSTRGVFTQVAAHLARGGKPGVLGRSPREIVTNNPMRPSMGEQRATGTVIHIDNYGNLITNFTRKWLKEVGGGRTPVIIARNKRFKGIQEGYQAPQQEGDIFALYNSDDMVEIAAWIPANEKRNSACSLLGLQVNSNVFIEFE